jgi:hypothetical protein
MIKEIIENNKLNVKQGNIIDMGWMNGWNDRMSDIYQLLRTHLVKDTNTSTTIGRCLTEYKFQANDGIETYTIISKVDSGD